MGLFDWFTTRKTEGKQLHQKSEPSDGAITIDMVTSKLSGSYTNGMALKIEAVFACLRDKSETIGQLPLKLYRKETDKARVIVDAGRNYKIFTQMPCEYLNTQGFMEMLVVSLERFGAFYAYIERNDRGSVMGIIPFRNQANVRPQMDINGNVYMTYTRNDGSLGDAYRLEDLFIVKGFTLDGFTPVSPMAQTASLLGIANAQEASQLETQTNGITSQMALSTDQIFNDDGAKQRLKTEWEQFRGPAGRSRVPIFEQGLKPVSLKLTPAETELLANRQYTVNRICRAFRVPLHRVGVPQNGSSATSMFDQDESYLRDSLNPLLKKAEFAFNQLLPSGFEVQFDRNAFFAGSPWRLVEQVERGLKGGMLSVNESRAALGLEPVEGGGVFGIDSNNVFYGTWDRLTEHQAQLYGAQQQAQNKPEPSTPVNEDENNAD